MYINFPISFSTTDKETVNFPVCTKISPSVFLQPTGEKLNFPVCTKISPCVLPQPARKGVFPCVFGYFPMNVFVTDKKR